MKGSFQGMYDWNGCEPGTVGQKKRGNSMKVTGVAVIVLVVQLIVAGEATAQSAPSSTGIPASMETLIRAGNQQGVDPLKNYWGDLEGFMNRQAEVTLGLVEEALVRFPPQIPEPYVRRMALLMMDGVLHDPGAPARPAVQAFFHSCMELATDEIETTGVSRGAIIWKLYDHGFVVRTPTVSVGFDLIRGYSAGREGFPLDNEVMNRIVDECDVLFISHIHGDHADIQVAQAFIDQGKPVVAPVEVWSDSTIHSSITHLLPQEHQMQRLAIADGRYHLGVVVYPGHQGESIQNNVVLVVSPEGLSFCHTGDQSNGDDFIWINEVRQHYTVDVLMPNCWTTDITRLVEGFDPKVVITGHENELGHSVDHREPYWLTYDRMSKCRYPLVLMTWGESFHYDPK